MRAPGIKEGGMLEHMLDELQISCLPGDIPAKIEVDVSGLDIGDMIRVGELTVPEGIDLLSDPVALVANCRPPHVAAAAGEAEEGAEGEAAAEAAPAEGEGSE